MVLLGIEYISDKRFKRKCAPPQDSLSSKVPGTKDKAWPGTQQEKPPVTKRPGTFESSPILTEKEMEAEPEREEPPAAQNEKQGPDPFPVPTGAPKEWEEREYE